MKKQITFLLLLIPLQLCFGAEEYGQFYDDGKWQKSSEKEGVTIYSRKMPNSDLLGFKSEGIISAPIEAVMANLRDVENSHLWTPDLKLKQTLKDIDDLTATTYSVTNMPWPLNARDYILYNKLELHKKRQLIFVISKSVPHKTRPLHNKHVRANIAYSNIGIRPVGKDKTYMEWTSFVDPKGWIPNWLVNFYQKDMPVGFIKALEKRSQVFQPTLKPGLVKILKRLRRLIKKEELKQRKLGSATE